MPTLTMDISCSKWNLITVSSVIYARLGNLLRVLALIWTIEEFIGSHTYQTTPATLMTRHQTVTNITKIEDMSMKSCSSLNTTITMDRLISTTMITNMITSDPMSLTATTMISMTNIVTESMLVKSTIIESVDTIVSIMMTMMKN